MKVPSVYQSLCCKFSNGLRKRHFLLDFQDRLDRCAQQCQDTIQDHVSPNTTQSELTKYQEELNTCVDQCCNTHLETLPKMFERMKKVLSEVKAPGPR